MSPAADKSKGGIIYPGEKYKSHVVNIRPPKWKERFWIGQISSSLEAQYTAEAVFHYIGRPSVHLKDANFTFPPLHLIGTSTVLTGRTMCSDFVSSIAQNPECDAARNNFIKSVEGQVRREVKSNVVQRILQNISDGEVAENANDDDHPTPMEVDEQAMQLLQQMRSNMDPGPGYIPSFDMSGAELSLKSADSQLDAGHSFLREYGQEHSVCIDEDSPPAELLPVEDYGSPDKSDLQNYPSSFDSNDLKCFLDKLDVDAEERGLCSQTRRSDWILFDPPTCEPCLTPPSDYPL